MKVYEALAKAFVEEGTSAVFGLMGDANMYWMNALDDLGVALYETRHEGNALGMADSWAFNSNGQPGVCTTTCGPGTSQLATSMIVGNRNRTTVVAFCGEAPVNNPDYVQAMDQKKFAAAVECNYINLYSPDVTYEIVRKAFYMAKRDRRPVMLGAPMDTQLATFEDDSPYIPSSSLLTGKAIAPNPDSLQEIAEVIGSSKYPVIVAGIGAKQAGAGDEILQLADRIGAVITTTLIAKNWLTEDEYNVKIAGLYATKPAMEIFQEADCVIAIGASMNSFTTEHGYLFPEAQFIQFDIQRQVVMGDGRAADYYVQADARLGVAGLNEVLDQRSFRQVGFRTPEVKEAIASAFDDPDVFDLVPGELDPRDVCRTIDSEIPSNFGLVIGSGHATNFAIFLMNRPRSFVTMRKSFGCIGQGLSNAIGAVIAHNNAPAFLVDGDASFMMHLAEFETAVRYKVPLLVMILNDEALGSEYHKSVAHGLKPHLSQITTPNLGAVGVALGGRGALVHSIEDLKKAIGEWTANPGPMLVDIRISRNVPSVQYRRAHFGKSDV